MLVLLIFVKVNIGVAAFAVAGLLFLFGIADDGKALKSLPWGTIVMVLAVGSLLNIVNKMGGIDLMSNALAKIMSKGTATPFMGISAALLSLVSSALGVVYPTMMPMCADIAAQVGGVNPVALMAAVGAGGLCPASPRCPPAARWLWRRSRLRSPTAPRRTRTRRSCSCSSTPALRS